MSKYKPTGIPKFDEALARKAAAEASSEALKRAKEASYAPDLIPERQYERDENDDLIDQVLNQLGIVEAYKRWCGKMKPLVRSGQKEGVMISCPIPGHADVHPSAWANTEKNTWFCGGCWQGGDIYTLASYKFGIEPSGKGFHDLRRAMVGDMGYVVQKSTLPRTPDNIYLPVPPPPTPAPAPAPKTVAEVTELAEEELEELEAAITRTFDWRNVVPEETFIHTYVSTCSKDDSPEEYHFWNAMLATGLAVGREIYLADFKPVYGNLLLCLLGRTGEGKSRAATHLKNILDQAIPYDARDDYPKGIKFAKSPASGEALIGLFRKEVHDPANPRIILDYAPIRGLIEYEELSSMVARTERVGSVLKDVTLQFYDADPLISTSSVTHGETTAKKPFGSILTTSQPESLKDLVKQTDLTNGFLNRWLFASGTAKTRIAYGGASIDLIDAAVKLQEIHCQVPRPISMTSKAVDLWTQHFHDVLEPLKRSNPILTRLDLLEKKIMLLLAINDDKIDVDENTIDAMLRLHDYLVQTFRVTAASTIKKTLYGEIIEDIRRQVRILTPKSGQYGVTKRRIGLNLKSKNYPPEAISTVFERFISRDDDIEVSMGDPNARGRKTEHFKWVG